MMYSLIDTYFVSHLGKSAIAAIGLSEQLGFFVFNFGSGFAIGTGVILARRIGEGNREAANHTATQAVMSMIFFSVLLVAVLYLALPSILLLLMKDPEVRHFAYLYLSVLLFGVPGNFITFLVSSIVRSSGNTVLPMTILVITTVINAILAPILIFGIGPVPALGMTGAGLATATAQLTGAGISLYVFMSGKTSVHFIREKFGFDFPLLGRIIRQAIPASLQMFSVSITRLSLFSIASTFGTSVVAAYTLGLKVDLFVFMTVFATGVAVEVATGQNLGAKKPERIWLFHKAAIRQLIWVVVILGFCAYFFGEYYAGIFTTDQSVISEAVTYLHIAVFGYLFFAVGLVTTRVISGAGAAIRSMAIVAGSLLFLQLPASYVLAAYTPLHQTGIWVGVVTGYILFTVIALVNLHNKKWMTARV
jgi:putative MATE family efflux protein